uniref:Uncharacterized protein n=1 Tax=Solanum lycopersicum TaxID=4081 RepID=A0A3Q7H677_SOLLC
MEFQLFLRPVSAKDMFCEGHVQHVFVGKFKKELPSISWKCSFCQASYMSLSLCPSNGDNTADAVTDAPLIQGPAKWLAESYPVWGGNFFNSGGGILVHTFIAVHHLLIFQNDEVPRFVLGVLFVEC